MTEPIKAKNLTAHLQYRGVGNPPTTHPSSAISNAFPGLEMDFRNVWRRILKGIQLHEATNLVMAVDENADPKLRVLESGWRLLSILDTPVMGKVKGPLIDKGPGIVDLPDTTFNDPMMPLEWSNALAEVLHNHEGRPVRCKFQNVTDVTLTIEFDLTIRPFFEIATIEGELVKLPVISRELAPPGELSQSLCSPWQNDYRECACFYWAATRPDYVNVETAPDGASTGHNWMLKARTGETPKTYLPDDWMDPRLVTYLDLFRSWEKSLRFVTGGTDEEPLPPAGKD